MMASVGVNPDIATARTGSVRNRQIQNRLVMLTSSGFSSSAAATVLGSSAMPQIGQSPGSSLTISGCMGQVYSVFDGWQRGKRGFKRHSALWAVAWTILTSNFGIHRACVFISRSRKLAARRRSCTVATGMAWVTCDLEAAAICIGREPMGAMPTSVFGVDAPSKPDRRYLAGSALNFCWQPEPRSKSNASCRRVRAWPWPGQDPRTFRRPGPFQGEWASCS